MQTISAEDFKKKYGTEGFKAFTAPEKKPGLLDRIKETALSGFQKAKEGAGQISSGINFGGKSNPNPLGVIEGGLKTGAGLVETVFSPLTAAIEPITKPTLGKAVKYTGDKISDIPAVQRFAMSNAGKTTSRITEDVNNLNTIASAAVGPKAAKSAGGAVVRAGEGAVSAAGEVASTVAKPLKGFVEGVSNVADLAIQEGRRIPDRIATNVAEKQATQAAIKQLPTKVAREAAQDGLDIPDVKYIYDIPKAYKAPLKQLANVVKEFTEGKTKTNPIEVVGKPIVNRIKQLEGQRTAIGKKLGKVADTLGEVSLEETFPKVFNSLKKVPGLSGLKVSKKGVLDFTDTVLTTAETATDRASIQDIFLEAVKKGTGKSKHLLRQELFEVLGGKKKALVNLTDTQEKALNAVRQGLSDVLEGKNGSYKTLSGQYRKIAQPLQDIRKFMKTTAGASEDILDMKAGLLARRLTSFAASNPEIRSILKAMDEATKVAGKTKLSVETLQDFYNILEKYYDISPKTGFQSQVRQGVEKAFGGPINYLAEQVKGFAGETSAVRQKALERILSDVFR